MVNVPTITLNNGIKMPAFGLGTYQVMFIKRAKITIEQNE